MYSAESRRDRMQVPPSRIRSWRAVPCPAAAASPMVVLETENLPGFRVGRKLEKLGQYASDAAELFLVNVRIPADHRTRAEQPSRSTWPKSAQGRAICRLWIAVSSV